MANLYTTSPYVGWDNINPGQLKDYIASLGSDEELVFSDRCLAKFIQVYLNDYSPVAPLRLDGWMGTSTLNLLNSGLADSPNLESFLVTRLQESIASVTGSGTDITALGRPISSAAYNSTTYATQNAFDSVPSTIFINKNNDFNWLGVQFDSAKRVFAVRLTRSSSNNDNSAYNLKKFEFQGSYDMQTWDYLGEWTGELVVDGDPADLILDFEAEFKAFRVVFKENNSTTNTLVAISSFELYSPTESEVGGCIFPSDTRGPLLASANPTYRKWIELMITGESTNATDPRVYEIMYGGTFTNPRRFLDEGKPITQMSLSELKEYQARYSNAVRAYNAANNKNYPISHAAGSIQLMADTLTTTQSQFPGAFPDTALYTPDIQTQIGIAIIMKRSSTFVGAVERAEYRGEMPSAATITTIRKAMATIWASIPYYDNGNSRYGDQPTVNPVSWWDQQIEDLFSEWVAEYNTYFN